MAIYEETSHRTYNPNLTVTVKFKRNEPKRYIFTNFDPIIADFSSKSWNNSKFPGYFSKILLTVK